MSQIAGVTGLEPATVDLTGRCSDQLKLHPNFNELTRDLHCANQAYTNYLLIVPELNRAPNAMLEVTDSNWYLMVNSHLFWPLN